MLIYLFAYYTSCIPLSRFYSFKKVSYEFVLLLEDKTNWCNLINRNKYKHADNNIIIS